MEDKLTAQDAQKPEVERNQTLPDEIDQSPILTAWERIWMRVQKLGWQDSALRLGAALVCLALVMLIIWVMHSYYLKGSLISTSADVALAAPIESGDTKLVLPAYAGISPFTGIARVNQIHTYIPNRSRFDIQEYTVQSGDNLFNIAEKYNLKPQTLMWGNYNVLADNPERLQPGQVLKILPVDGVLYDWHAGDGLNKVAEVFGVKPEDIINWPGNNLNAETLGDYSNPNIEAGTPLVVPGGKREFVDWMAPRIRRDQPAKSSVWGAGQCGPITSGPIGDYVYVWPTTEHRVSGYDFSPETNHWGIDIAGKKGNPIYAVDKGVVVYQGWSDWGYGNLVIIDHGDGWQSLYGHLDSFNVECGAYITYAGQLIGSMGSTGRSSGPHLHFELRNESQRVNPRNYLPF